MDDKVCYKNAEEISYAKESAELVSKTLGELSKHIKAGITPLALDKIAYTFIKDHKATPAFLGLYGFPNTLCVSVNAQIVHGIPTKCPLKSGDIVSIDCGVKHKGFYGDQAYTFPVEEISKEHLKLLQVTQRALLEGVHAMQIGARIGDIGYAIQNTVAPHHYGIVRELVGHGLGKNLHEAPEVPNYGKRGNGMSIQEGLLIAIEPMINLGTEKIRQSKDQWTLCTADGQFSAHYEHNVAILHGKREVLTTFEYINSQVAITPYQQTMD